MLKNAELFAPPMNVNVRPTSEDGARVRALCAPGSPEHAEAVKARHTTLQRRIGEVQRRLDAKEKEVHDQHHEATMQIIQHSKSHRELTAAESERAQANWHRALDFETPPPRAFSNARDGPTYTRTCGHLRNYIVAFSFGLNLPAGHV